jgi:WD40 repeat protein
VSTNGIVEAVAQSGNHVYIGGLFTLVGPTTGPAVATDRTTGEYDPAMPKVSGSGAYVSAVVSDGHGGWYVGGHFTHVGGVPRRHLAHILPDKTVDPNWNPDPSGSGVNSIVLGPDGTIWVSGGLGQIGANRVARDGIAALDPRTGDATSWQTTFQGPPPPDQGYIATLAIHDGKLYVGGYFAGVGGQPRNNIAALDLRTAQVEPFNPSPNAVGTVWAFAFSPDGTVLYTSGSFTTIGGQSRNSLAALDPATGSATAWNPNPTGKTTNCNTRGESALAVAPSGLVYYGACFTSIGGQSRTALAALDPTSGNATAWNPNPSGQAFNVLSTHTAIYALSLAPDGTVYVGGNFTQIGGQSRNNLVALDPGTANATSWNPRALYPATTIAADGTGQVYVGGDFAALDVKPRIDIAAIDTTTGTLEPFTADATSSTEVFALGVAPPGSPKAGTVYAGGTFSMIDGQARNVVAALDPVTGQPTSWDPHPDFSLSALTVAPDGTVYIGGGFTRIGSGVAPAVRNGLAAIDPTTGQPTSWNPAPASTNGTLPGIDAMALAPSGGTLYVGGIFSSIGAQVPQPSRQNIAALDLTTGNATAWNPGANSSVGTIAVAPGPGGPVYLAGAFTTIGANNQTRANIAAVDPATGNVTNWNPNPTGTPLSQAGLIGSFGLGADGTVYIGGSYTGIGATPAQHVAFAGLDPSTANSTSFDLGLDPLTQPSINAATVGPNGMLYVGGALAGTDLSPQWNFASFGQAPPPPVNSARPQASGTPQVGQTLGCSPGSWSGSIVYYAYQWLRDGSPIDDSARTFYLITTADQGHTLSCQVTANNYGGSATATSASMAVPPAAGAGPGGTGGGGGAGGGTGGTVAWSGSGPSSSSGFGPGSSGSGPLGTGRTLPPTSLPTSAASQAPVFTLRVPRSISWLRLQSSGLLVRVSCGAACGVASILVAGRRSARRAASPEVVVGRGAGHLPAPGRLTIRVRVLANALRRLERRQRVVVTLRVRVSNNHGVARTQERQLALAGSRRRRGSVR